MTTFTFKAMNSLISITLEKKAELFTLVEGIFEEVEKTASRFIEGNALHSLNSGAVGVPIFLGPILSELTEKSLILSRRTNYAVNPFMGEIIKKIGYRTSFSTNYQPGEMDAAPNDRTHIPEEPVDILSPSWIMKKREFSFDFGGFGKGFAVDKAKDLLKKEGEEGALINAGGDIAVIGSQEAGVQHPLNTGFDIARFTLTDCALATSGKNVRKWMYKGKDRHHLINGLTGHAADNGVLQASVIARTAMEAETASKVFNILPYEEAKQWLYKYHREAAFLVYFENETFKAGGNKHLFQKLEVAP
ncbi:FAD:protein FMN transferase [Peribacillus kribbensis]|uniref:FAD:protein FMN transferase n=1 Tax=Peribacillus kribbensis TaxID=356658 RepID=UPI000414A795|nr:FAD:protein FMN transferase [Peribacillus kribbensis]